MVNADYTFSLEVGRLSITGNQLANGSCCEYTETVDNCSSPCQNTRLRICLQGPGSTREDCLIWETVLEIPAEINIDHPFTSPAIRSIWPVCHD